MIISICTCHKLLRDSGVAGPNAALLQEIRLQTEFKAGSKQSKTGTQVMVEAGNKG